ncbi:MAG: chemotaxis protein CheW [Thermoanaerobaculia bacterium]
MNDLTKELLEDFRLESRERIDRVEDGLLTLAGAAHPERQPLVLKVRLELHTLKGNSGMMGFDDLQALAHELEDEIDRIDLDQPDLGPFLTGLDRMRTRVEELAAPGPHSDATDSTETTITATESGQSVRDSVRVPADKLDSLVDAVAESLIARNRLTASVELGLELDVTDDDYITSSVHTWGQVQEALHSLSKELEAIQEQTLRLRMVPLSTLFGKLKRLVHDEALKSGKEARLTTQGGETTVDKALADFAGDALGHLVRNAVHHGIETPKSRQRSGKSPCGTIHLAAAVVSGMVEIDLLDDGAGIDHSALLAAARRHGLDAGDDEDLRSLVFQTGISTRTQTDLSAGRGVGLAAVRNAAHLLGGSIDLASEKDLGTHFRLRLPTQASITQALLVRVDSERYALPVMSVVDTLALAGSSDGLAPSAGQMDWRGRGLDLLDLGQGFGTSESRRRHGHVVVVAAEGSERGLIVDEIEGIHQIVVKQLDRLVAGVQGISGSTILGDGRVVMILDAADLATLPLPEAQPS